MAKTKAFNLAELIRHISYDADEGKIVSTTSLESTGRAIAEHSAPDNNPITLHQFAHASFRTAEYVVTATNGSDYHTTKLVVTHDGSNTYDTQFADLYSNSALVTLTTSISGANVALTATPHTGATDFKFFVEYVDA